MMMMQNGAVPEVSVLIPVYNCGDYLEASLCSMVKQTLHDLEIIVVNDGSTDGSGTVLDRAAATDHRIRVLHQPNGGIVAALNAGLEVARGRYIARMDGDDVAWPERLEKQRDFMDEHPDHVCVGTLFRTIDAAGEVIHVQRPGGPTRTTDVMNFPPLVVSLPHPTLMLRRDVMKKLGGYRSFFPHAEDQDLYIRLSRYGKLAVLPEVLLDYRVHASATSARNRAAQIDSVLKAQCAAMIQERNGEDVFAHAEPLSLAEMLEGRGNLPSLTAWETLRAVYEVDHDLDRRDTRAGQASVFRLIGCLRRNQSTLRRDGILQALVRRTARSLIRLAYMRLKEARGKG